MGRYERPAQGRKQCTDEAGRGQDGQGQRNDEGKADEVAQDAVRKAAVVGGEMAVVRKMVHAFGALDLRHIMDGMPVQGRRDEGRQEHCQQNKGYDASGLFHKIGANIQIIPSDNLFFL